MKSLSTRHFGIVPQTCIGQETASSISKLSEMPTENVQCSHKEINLEPVSVIGMRQHSSLYDLTRKSIDYMTKFVINMYPSS